MILRSYHLVSALLVSIFACSQAAAQPEDSVTIEIDATAQGAPLKSVWSYFGYDEANYTTTPEAKELLRTLSSANTSPVYVRTHFLFNTGDGTPSLKWGSTNIYTEDAAGDPIYDYTLIDQIMDATLDSGTLPLFEIGFMPKALSSHPEPYENAGTTVLDGGSYYPPADHEKWAALVSAWAEHVKVRYAGTQTNWMWELWNEPDIGYFKGTVEDYARLYDYTEAALHAVLPDAQLGGPAVVRVTESFLSEFLEHCESGTNAVTGQTGTRLDMVSFHAKGGVARADAGHVQMDLGAQLDFHRIGFETIAASEKFADAPVVISEADPDGCAACPSSIHRYLDYRNHPAYGAYEVAMMKRTLDLAEDVGVDLKGVLTWAFTFPGTPYFAGYRALSTNGITLPVLNAFKLLGQLNGRRLPLTSSGALLLDDILEQGVRSAADVDALAVRDGDKIQVLVWNYHDDLIPADPVEMTVELKVPSSYVQSARVNHQRVDESHGNAFSVWSAQGSPATPNEAQLAELHAAMDSLQFEPEHLVKVRDGSVSLSFQLPRFGVSLITLSPSNERAGESAVGRDAGCSCQMLPPSRTNHPIVLTALLALVIHRRRTTERAGIAQAARRMNDAALGQATLH